MSAPKRPRTDEGEGEMSDKIKKDTSDEIKDSDKHFYDDGNVYVISSDNWRFKVHDYHLKSVSAVFRSMFNGPTRDSPAEITLTDGKLETEVVLRTFFDYLYTGNVPELGDGWTRVKPSDPMPRCVYLWHFLEKYECTLAQKHVKLLLKNVEGLDGEHNIDVFVVGAGIDQPDICELAIRRGRGAHTWEDWDVEDPGSLDVTVLERDHFDLFSMPISNLEMIPLRYIMAYQRACYTDTPDTGTPLSNDEVADRFIKIIRAHKDH